jgi:histidinol-phosphate/aromatic aminotransferase/cobyric acid decarboxylase-like protein
MLKHGGNLRDAAKMFSRPLDDWLDLSTGINPHFYPAPVLAPNAWHRLPEYSDDLIDAAQTFTARRACSRWLAVRRQFKHCHVCVRFRGWWCLHRLTPNMRINGGRPDMR